MTTPGLQAAHRSYDWRVANAARVLAAGGVVVHPTEAVFGIAASAFSPTACAYVERLKSRRPSQHFIVIGASFDQIASLVSLDTRFRAEIEASWPGPATWILEARPGAPGWLIDERGRIAVRVTAHAQAADLCRRAGPLISTSANLAGRAPATSLFAAKRAFGPLIGCYLPGQLGAQRRPSRIRDGVTGEIVRA